MLRDIEARDEAAIEKTAKLTGLAVYQARTAARYYQEFTNEVDAWIAEVDRQAEEAYPHRTAR